VAIEARLGVGLQLAVLRSAGRVDEVVDLVQSIRARNLQHSRAALIRRDDPGGSHALE
jgi:hypothetical protein